ncbi:hypothetical protein GPALN_012374 [Globodera pallida]|nr:hypothetical protein GPALN_012374 [Globodera pallida]
MSDLGFFTVMLPHSLALFFGTNLRVRYPYLLYRQELSALANWFSASSSILIFAVTIERIVNWLISAMERNCTCFVTQVELKLIPDHSIKVHETWQSGSVREVKQLLMPVVAAALMGANP